MTAGSFRAVAARHPGVGLLVFDAHLDLRDQYEDSPWSHACVVRRILEEHGTPTQWCGTRSACQEEFDFLAEHDLKPFFAHHLDPQRHWIETLVERLPERVYLSIDVDGLDPSVMPGTGTPEPGGPGYRDLLALIRELFARRRVVAADIVELAPIPGQHVSEFTAAKIATKVLGSAWRARNDV